MKLTVDKRTELPPFTVEIPSGWEQITTGLIQEGDMCLPGGTLLAQVLKPRGFVSFKFFKNQDIGDLVVIIRKIA